MSLKKKGVALLSAILMAGTVLTGCGGSGNSGSGSKDGGTTTLKMWTIATESDSFHQPYLDAIKDFEKAHPGVKIEMETFENEAYKTKIKAAVAANDLPDVFFTWAGGFSKSFVESGKVHCLDSYYSEYEKDIPKAALANDVYDGKLYGSVTCTPVSVMWYNEKLFKDNGVEVPKTWDEFKAACQTFISKGITPIGTSVKDTWVLAMLHDGLALKSAGTEKVTKALTKQGQSYNDPDFVKAATCIKELVDMKAFIKGATGLSNDEASAEFYKEKVAMYFTGSWMGGSIMTDAKKPENFSVAPIPVVNDQNAKVTDFMGGGSDTLMVSESSENKDLAAKAAFEITRSVSKYAYLSGAGIPAWKVDYDAKDVPQLTQKVADLAANATSYTLWFDTLMSSDDAGEYLTLLQALFSGDKSPQAFVQGMDEQLSKK
ncbi:extracellular solute-binding protein [Eubacterium xylanophilum]|uniref:extracellular solute-binding protein n=1 Tax=Eubacterium xylanophilum TaxID=39497 RepID=UPI00047AA74B|nr:extracellular solute-binding protein [Eubacterium xylanophilum]